MTIGFRSTLLRDAYTSERVGGVFSAESTVAAWLKVEGQLAAVQAELGLIPEKAAAEIESKAVLEHFDMPEYRRLAAVAVHPIVPLISILSTACEDGAGEYVHWGATTQDIMDTGLVLQLREIHEHIVTVASHLIDRLASLAEEHRGTLMPGRTHSQHAVPITFGYKLGGYVAELRRGLRRLDAAWSDAGVVQFGGAAGTLSSLGADGLAVRRELAMALSLDEPEISWHTARDRLSNHAFQTVALANAAARFCQEVVILQRPEIGELAEPFHWGKVGSSTMPHKRNPSLSEAVMTVAAQARHSLVFLLNSGVHEHERDMPNWQAEWEAIPRGYDASLTALETAGTVAAGLVVNSKRMASNVALTQGLIHSESLMMALAPVMGRQTAHEVVYELAMKSVEEEESFEELVTTDPRLGDVQRIVKDVMSGMAETKAAEAVLDVVL